MNENEIRTCSTVENNIQTKQSIEKPQINGFLQKKHKSLVENNSCLLNIASDNRKLMDSKTSKKVQKSNVLFFF